MRIGILFPSIYASPILFPDKIFAPRELATSLSNGLVDRGHEVVVFSVPDAETKAKVASTSIDAVVNPLEYYKFRGLEAGKHRFLNEEFAKHQFELSCILQAFAALKNKEIDILHVYHDSTQFFSHYAEEFLGGNLPVVYTLHDPLPPENSFEYREFSRFAHHKYIAISNMFRKSSLPLNFIETIYHGIDLSQYPYRETASEAYLFLGRLVPEKGLHTALSVVNRANVPLIVSTNIPVGDEAGEYYAGEIRPHIGTRGITVLPVVCKEKRIELYGNARALLFPIGWEEPFGIVLIEAMATGTPVIAYNRGSVPEIVVDGVTGYIIDPDNADRPGKGSRKITKQGEDGIIDAMGQISSISRRACRDHVEHAFSAGKMVENYEHLYKKVLNI
jgi:glycosyltransferase involved in cell wall biosynthesis